MQSFDTKNAAAPAANEAHSTTIVSRVEDFPVASCKTVELPEGHELAVFNVDGEFYAINNFCPHKGAPLSEGIVCGRVVECGLHGWQFDLPSGECLTVEEKIETYKVTAEDGVVRVEVTPATR